MQYVLKLCGWYPSKMDAFSGDFVQRHALSIATQMPVVAVFAVKDSSRHHGGIIVEKYIGPQLEEYIFYYPRKRLFDTLWSQYYYLKVIRQLIPQLLIQKGVPLLVHVNIVWKAAIWAFYLRKRYGWPLVITENSTEYQSGALLQFNNFGPGRKKITRIVFKNCKRFIPVSHQLGAQVNQLFGNIPFTVVSNAVDTNLFYPTHIREQGPFRLLHVSTLNYQKNVEGLKHVFAQLVSLHRNLEITIIGPLDQSLKDWCNENAARRSQIKLTGLIPYSKVAEYMRRADLLVLFSRYENLPCVILEAHCSGVPVVSTNVGGVAEVIDKSNGRLVENENEEELLKIIDQAIKGEITFDRNEIAKLASEKYNYTEIGKSFIKAYRDAGIKI